MNEKISIIVPVFNAEKTLVKCVDALIGQSYNNIEIILVDDGSTDNSFSICEYYTKKDSRIKVIHKFNRGVSAARNAGLDVAVGDFIMFCDSDDWVELDWCEQLIKAFKPECLVMCGQYIEGKQNFFPHKFSSQFTFPRKDFFQLKMKMFNVPWNKIFLKSVIENNSIRYDENLTNGEDLLFNITYLGCITGKIISIDQCLYHYTWPDQTSLSKYIPQNYIKQRNYLMKKIENAIHKIGNIGFENWLQFYTDFFNEYLKVLYSVYSDKSKTIRERINKGNEIMRCHEYKYCVEKVFMSSKKKDKILYEANNCYGLFLWFKIHNLQKGYRRHD